MKTLVVVDMQEFFFLRACKKVNADKKTVGQKRLIKNTKIVVDIWKEKNWPIIFLEYNLTKDDIKRQTNKVPKGSDVDINKTIVSTLPELIPDNYKNYIKLRKETDGGGQNIISAIKYHRLPIDIVICGINLSACVGDTIDDLCYFIPNDKKLKDRFKLSVIEECTKNLWDMSEKPSEELIPRTTGVGLLTIEQIQKGSL